MRVKMSSPLSLGRQEESTIHEPTRPIRGPKNAPRRNVILRYFDRFDDGELMRWSFPGNCWSAQSRSWRSISTTWSIETAGGGGAGGLWALAVRHGRSRVCQSTDPPAGGETGSSGNPSLESAGASDDR